MQYSLLRNGRYSEYYWIIFYAYKQSNYSTCWCLAIIDLSLLFTSPILLNNIILKRLNYILKFK